jgi:hypothetical protein
MTISWLPPLEPDDLYPVYDFTVELGDAEYRYVLTYRERQDGWYIDLYDADDAALLTGKRIAVGVAPLWRHEKDGIPEGQILVIDRADTDVDPTYEDMGYRVQLAWVPTEDIPDSTTDFNVTITVT